MLSALILLVSELTAVYRSYYLSQIARISQIGAACFLRFEELGFFFWPGWNPVGIDGVAVGLGIEPRSKDQAYRHGIRDVVSTRPKGFLWFLLI